MCAMAFFSFIKWESVSIRFFVVHFAIAAVITVCVCVRSFVIFSFHYGAPLVGYIVFSFSFTKLNSQVQLFVGA